MKYDVVIGLEVHCELKTKTKVFSKGVNTYTTNPNINVNELDIGLPGVMPVLSMEAAEKAIKTALIFHATIPNEFLFDRKNYYYADLPKGFQITQKTKPIGWGGYLEIYENDTFKKIDLTELHLEEDTASLIHGENETFIDYNRSGIPLIEIVSEPCMTSADEAILYLETLRSALIYGDISEAKMERGEMRCDLNISLKPKGTTELGSKVEIKNINSFTNVRDAIAFETDRQSDLLDRGEPVLMETRKFDDVNRVTSRMRTKVEAIDYKYFIEPNILPLRIDQQWVEKIEKTIPVLENVRLSKYINEYKLSKKDATTLTKTKELSDYYDECVSIGGDPIMVANMMNTKLLEHLNNSGESIQTIYVRPNMLVSLIKAVANNQISNNQAKEVLGEALSLKKDPNQIIKEKNLSQISNEEEIVKLVMEVIQNNMEFAKTYSVNPDKVLAFLTGQVMKLSAGRVNPGLARKILEEELKK